MRSLARPPRLPSLAPPALLGTLLLAWPSLGSAAETPADVATDHVDAVEEGGPRYVRVAVQPLSPALGLAQGELDVAIGEHVALAGGLGWLVGPDGAGYRASAGVAVFPYATVFHGLYATPRVEWTRLPDVTSFGGAAIVGYAWTWPFGATTSFGVGLAYARGSANAAGAVVAFGGFEPRFDSAVGWLF
jgi:hypothetical protein